MNRLILQFLLLPAFLWKRMGVDVEKLRLILATKLKLDDRRPLTAFNTSYTSKKKETSGSNLLQLFVMVVMGAVFLFYFFLIKDTYVAYSLYFSSLMCVLALMLIADFSAILIDTRDQYIILPRPVDDRTFAISRVLHIGILLLALLSGLALPGLVYTTVVHGPAAGAIFLLQAFLTGVLTLLLVTQFYLMMISWLSPQQLKDLIATFQIVFSVVIFASYYFGPVLLRSEWIQRLRIETAPWSWVLPPVWIASLQQLWAPPLAWLNLALSLLGIVAPMGALWLIVRIFSSGFNDKLAALAGGDERQKPAKTGRLQQRTWCNRMASVLTRTPLESAGFNIVWLVTGRSREFKQKLYPTFAYIPVYFVFMFFVGFGGKGVPRTFADKLEHMRENGTFIVLFYLSLFSLMSVFQFIAQSGRYKAAWVYKATPLSLPGMFMSGVLKAALTKFFFPFILALTLVGVPLFGIAIINDAILATAIGSIEALLIALFTMKAYPFSQPLKQTGGSFIATLAIMSLVGLLGYGHYLIMGYERMMWAACLIAWAIFAVMLHYFQKDRWETLRT